MTGSHNPTFPLPERFKTRIRSLYGPEGAGWLKTFPARRDLLRKRWSLENSQPVKQLSYNYLEYAHSPEHGPVVLKIGFPNPELFTEINTLEHYRGLGAAVRLLEWDLDQGALLLERISPGYNLVALADDLQAARIAAQAMVDLQVPEPDGKDFPTMEKWCQGFSRYQQRFAEGGPLPAALVGHASGLVRELLDSREDQYLLHGDLHHGNLLFREDGSWIVIDPKGVIAEFACEAGPFLFNPIPGLIQRPNLGTVLDQRLEVLADITGQDRLRLAAWSYCRAVLSAIWSVEENGDHIEYGVEIAEKIKQLIK